MASQNRSHVISPAPDTYTTMALDESRTNALCSLLVLIISHLADDVASVSVDAIDTGVYIHITIRVATNDLGRVIGRDGRMAIALRDYVRAYRLQHGGKYRIEIQAKLNF